MPFSYLHIKYKNIILQELYTRQYYIYATYEKNRFTGVCLGTKDPDPDPVFQWIRIWVTQKDQIWPDTDSDTDTDTQHCNNVQYIKVRSNNHQTMGCCHTSTYMKDWRLFVENIHCADPFCFGVLLFRLFLSCFLLAAQHIKYIFMYNVHSNCMNTNGYSM